MMKRRLFGLLLAALGNGLLAAGRRLGESLHRLARALRAESRY